MITHYFQEVLFFPQMRPEKIGGKKPIELVENEKFVFDQLKNQGGNTDLNALKTSCNLSNKQWDKALKGLRSHNLVEISKNEDQLTIFIKD